MTRISLALAALLLAGAAGCATGRASQTPAAPLPSAEVPMPGNLVPDGYAGRYRVAATVLQNRQHGPQLCTTVMESLPPQCGGPDIAGWTWDGLPHESASGTTWGSYVITGTFDGHTFTLTEPANINNGQFTPNQPAPPDFSTPCPAPAGGWRPTDPAKATDDAMQAANTIANADPDFAGLWIDQDPPPSGPSPMNDPTKLVLNVRFTKDLARHEAEIRRVWGGALCVSEARHTMTELTDLQRQVAHEPGISYTSVDIVTGTIEVGVFVATRARQHELDTQYGSGLIRLVGVLVPID
jgi:hypothetical protein